MLEMSALARRQACLDGRFMAACLALARRGLGLAAPNPTVAAIVVRGGPERPRVIGRGVTAPGGRPHAENLALAEAGEAARGATLYVTLEPCAARSQRWFGPSCTEAIIAAGIARLVYAADDPSPFAAGAGPARLAAAGIEVVRGPGREEAERLNIGHLRKVRDHRPALTLKLAMTADGFAASADGRPLAITGEAARAFTHRLRAAHEGILVGIGTVLADDPLLTCRLPGLQARSPLRIVADTSGRMPANAAMLAPGLPGATLVATAAPERLAGRAGLEILAVPAGATGGLDLRALLGALAARGLTRLFVEGGPTLAAALAAEDLLDEIVLLQSPDAPGAGLPAILPPLAERLLGAAFARPRTLQLGRDRAIIHPRRS